ncbi:MAG: transcriptional repressor LexA [Clostridia bacterium]
MAQTTEKKLKNLLAFIESYTEINKYPPSVREMCKGVSVSSTATIAYYLTKLEKNGQIKKSGTKNRAIEIISNAKKSKSVSIPLIGKVAAGVPILAEENVEELLALPKEYFNQEDLFILSVQGESMINAGIFNGDKIIVKKQSTAENGQIAVAMIDGNATVKRFFKEKNQIRLQPENDTFEPIYTTNVDILGVVVGLLRKY